MKLEIDEFLAQKTIANSTKETYGYMLMRFERWLIESHLSPENIKAADILKFTTSQGWGSAACYQAVCAVRGYYAWGFGANHPVTRVRVKRIQSPPQRTMTEEQVTRLLKICDDKTTRGERDKALLHLMIDSGLRESEICRLKLDDVDLTNLKLTVLCKGGHYGEGLFSPQTARILNEWKDIREKIARPGNKTFFCSVGGLTRGAPLTPSGLKIIFRYLSVKVGFRVSPHDCRRTFATLLTERGAPTEMVRRAGRWSNSEMVKLYTRRARVDAIRRFLPFESNNSFEQSKTRLLDDESWSQEYQ